MTSKVQWMKRGLAVAAMCAVAAVAAPVASQTGANARPWLEGEFTVDPYHTFTTFEYDHFGLSTMRGRFKKTTGTIAVAKDGRNATVDVSIDVNSIDTGVELLDRRLKDAMFFDAEKHPTITFKASGVTMAGDKMTEVPGQLTIKGVTKPVTLKVSRADCKQQRNPTLNFPACGADAELVINRSEFGVGAFAPLVSDRIRIAIAVEALKGAEAIEAQFQPFKK